MKIRALCFNASFVSFVIAAIFSFFQGEFPHDIQNAGFMFMVYGLALEDP